MRTVAITHNRLAILIACVAALASLLYSYFIAPPLNVDAKAHNRIAANIARGNGYWETLPVDTAFDRAIGRSGPLLEYWVAGAYTIFGENLWVVWVMHALMHGITTLLLYRVYLLLFGDEQKNAGLTASALYGFYPDLIESSAMLMTETSFLLLMVAMLYFFIRYTKTATGHYLLGFAVTAALSFLAKSTIALAGIPLVVYFIYHKRYRDLIIVSIICIGIVSPWVIRNYRAFGIFIPSRLYSYYTLYVGNHHGASGENENHLMVDAKTIEDQSGVFALEAYSRDQFFSFVRKYPIEYIALHFKRVSLYFSWLRPTGHWPYLTRTERLFTYGGSVFFSVIIFTFGLSGMWYIWRSRRQYNALLPTLIIFTILLPLPFLLTVVETRYRYPLYPMAALFAASGMYRLWRQRIAIHVRPIIVSFLILAGNTAVDLTAHWQRFIDRINS